MDILKRLQNLWRSVKLNAVVNGDGEEVEYYSVKVHDFDWLVETIQQQQKEIEELSKDSELLNCLEACGVDNWSGWDDAIEMFNSEEGE